MAPRQIGVLSGEINHLPVCQLGSSFPVYAEMSQTDIWVNTETIHAHPSLPKSTHLWNSHRKCKSLNPMWLRDTSFDWTTKANCPLQVLDGSNSQHNLLFPHATQN